MVFLLFFLFQKKHKNKTKQNKTNLDCVHRAVGAGVKILSSNLIIPIAYLEGMDEGPLIKANLLQYFQKGVDLNEKEMKLEEKKKKTIHVRFPADMKFHQELLDIGGLHDEENQTCFRCDEAERKKFLSVVACEARMKFSQFAELHHLNVETLLLLNNPSMETLWKTMTRSDESGSEIVGEFVEVGQRVRIFPDLSLNRVGIIEAIFFYPCATHALIRLAEGNNEQNQQFQK